MRLEIIRNATALTDAYHDAYAKRHPDSTGAPQKRVMPGDEGAPEAKAVAPPRYEIKSGDGLIVISRTPGLTYGQAVAAYYDAFWDHYDISNLPPDPAKRAIIVNGLHLKDIWELSVIDSAVIITTSIPGPRNIDSTYLYMAKHGIASTDNDPISMETVADILAADDDTVLFVESENPDPTKISAVTVYSKKNFMVWATANGTDPTSRRAIPDWQNLAIDLSQDTAIFTVVFRRDNDVEVEGPRVGGWTHRQNEIISGDLIMLPDDPQRPTFKEAMQMMSMGAQISGDFVPADNTIIITRIVRRMLPPGTDTPIDLLMEIFRIIRGQEWYLPYITSNSVWIQRLPNDDLIRIDAPISALWIYYGVAPVFVLKIIMDGANPAAKFKYRGVDDSTLMHVVVRSSKSVRSDSALDQYKYIGIPLSEEDAAGMTPLDYAKPGTFKYLEEIGGTRGPAFRLHTELMRAKVDIQKITREGLFTKKTALATIDGKRAIDIILDRDSRNVQSSSTNFLIGLAMGLGIIDSAKNVKE